MVWLQQLLVIVVYGAAVCSSDDWPLHPDDMLDTCIDSKLHKKKPGPEADRLHGQCSGWSNFSCCTNDVSLGLHKNDSWHKFNWNHCPGQPLSEKCKRHFTQDLCFYECSPFVGPWLVKDSRSWRKSRFMHVPLCASDCDSWYNDCLDDYTCRANWGRGGFNFTTGESVCPVDSECRTFRDVYSGNSSLFCELLWDYSFTYTLPPLVGPRSPDEPMCMTLWPQSGDNRNRRVAEARVAEIRRDIGATAAAAAHTVTLSLPHLTASSLVITTALHLITPANIIIT